MTNSKLRISGKSQVTKMFDAINHSTKCRGASSLSLERVAEAKLPTEMGEFRLIGYRSLVSDEEFVVLARGEFAPDEPTLARVHSQCLTVMCLGRQSATADSSFAPQ